MGLNAGAKRFCRQVGQDFCGTEDKQKKFPPKKHQKPQTNDTTTVALDPKNRRFFRGHPKRNPEKFFPALRLSGLN